jgi:hypothetical protein
LTRAGDRSRNDNRGHSGYIDQGKVPDRYLIHGFLPQIDRGSVAGSEKPHRPSWYAHSVPSRETGRKQSLVIPSKNFSFGQNPEFMGKLLGP